MPPLSSLSKHIAALEIKVEHIIPVRSAFLATLVLMLEIHNMNRLLVHYWCNATQYCKVKEAGKRKNSTSYNLAPNKLEYKKIEKQLVTNIE